MTLHWAFKHLIMVAVLIGGCIIGSVLLSRWFGGSCATPESAYQVASSFAQEQLGSNGVVEYPSFENSFVVKQESEEELAEVLFIVSSYIEVTDKMNKTHKHNYKCELKVSSGNLWTLVNLNYE